jgi:hypothetical protein
MTVPGSGWPGWAAAHGMALKVAGAVLLLAGLALVAMTGRSLMLYQAAVARHGGDVLAATDTGPQSGMHGGMVHVSGPLRVVEPPRDEEFNLSVPTPVLTRHVEMFQWREVRVGDVVHYELDWSDRPQDSRGFERPAGHANPGEFPVQGKQFDAGRVQLGRYALGPALLHALPGSQPVTPDLQHLPANLAASFSLYQNALVTSADPASPRLGDVRVYWDAVPVQPVTILARQDGDQLVPAADAAAGGGYDLQIGEHSLSDMLTDVPVPPALTTLRRVLSVLLASLGVFALLWGRGRRWHDGPVALGLGAMAVGAIACAQWLGNDATMALNWLALGATGGALALWRLSHGHSDKV